MILLQNVPDTVDTRLLDASVAGSRMRDLLAAELSSIGITETREIRGRGSPAPVELGDVDLLLADANVWLAIAIPRRLIAQDPRRITAIALPTQTSGNSVRTPDVAALFVPAGQVRDFLVSLQNFDLGGGVGAVVRLANVKAQIELIDDPSEGVRVTTLVELARLERRILHQRALVALGAGVRLRDPDTTAIRGTLECGQNVEIDQNVIVEGRVRLGEGVRVGANAILINSTIGAHTRIEAYSLVENSVVGDHCLVGPYARLRPGTSIGDHSQIGNFVEIKNSVIGCRARINHHSFVGDAELADDVTLGAGTITCNHNQLGTVHTQIGAGAYIGSGTQLVAPIVIGAGATVGAGSTITEDVPPGKLTVARARQVTIEGWIPPAARP